MTGDLPPNDPVEPVSKTNSINRRRFVKALGAASGGALGLGSSQVAAAQTPQTQLEKATQSDINRVRQAEETQQLLAEVGNPTIQKDKAQKLIITIDGSKLKAVMLATPLGEVMYGETGGGRTFALLTVGGAVLGEQPAMDRKLRKRLPQKYHTLPNDVHVKISVEESSKPTLVRTATSNELEEISQETGEPVESLSAAIGSNASTVYVKNENNESVITIDLPEDDIAYSEISPGQLRGGATTTGLSVREVSSQDLTCWGWCWHCASGSQVCISCAIECAAGLVTWALMIACVACLVYSCSVAGNGCATCFDCMPN